MDYLAPDREQTKEERTEVLRDMAQAQAMAQTILVELPKRVRILTDDPDMLWKVAYAMVVEAVKGQVSKQDAQEMLGDFFDFFQAMDHGMVH